MMSERIELLYTRLAGKVVGQKISLPWRVCFSLTAFHLHLQRLRLKSVAD